ncbi:MAG: hypothetical protein AAF400_01060 [Bacteroidota bacterium]
MRTQKGYVGQPMGEGQPTTYPQPGSFDSYPYKVPFRKILSQAYCILPAAIAQL